MFKITKNYFLKDLVTNFLVGKSILIIDDEPEIRNILTQYLVHNEIPSHLILQAADGEEALEVFKTQKIGLIIVDLKMPRMNGLDFIREVKKAIHHQTIPIIINSGYLNREILQFASHHGIKDILVKPFNEEIFIDKFCYALGLHLQ